MGCDRLKLLKNDGESINKIKGILASIITNLGDVDSEQALELCQWFLKESDYKNRHYNGKPFPILPKGIKQGDIVWVEFGINIGDEFSDQFKNGHYAMVWTQQGFIFTVIPLTSDGKKSINDCAINIGTINGLPLTGDTYLKLDMIRSIHIRRIRKLNNIPEGKISITDTNIINTIKHKIVKKYIF